MSARFHSEVWYHFTPHSGPEKKAKCHYCHATISIAGGSMGNLGRHLRLKHPTVPRNQASPKRPRPSFTVEEEIEIECLVPVITTNHPQSDSDVKLEPSCSSSPSSSFSTLWQSGEATEALVTIHTPTSLAVETLNQLPLCSQSHLLSLPSSSTSSSTLWQSAETTESMVSVHTPTSPAVETSSHLSVCRSISTTKPNPLDKCSAFDIQLTKMICKGFYSFSLVEDEEFKALIRMLCPGYSLPCRKTLTSSILPSLYQTQCEEIQNRLYDVSAVCLTCDSWTSLNNSSIYSITAHYFDEETVLHSSLLECSEFSVTYCAEDVSDWISNVIKNWKIDSKIIAAVTDSETNIIAALEILNITPISCYAHSLNAVVREAIEASMQDVLAKVKAIVQYFKENTSALSKMNEMQSGLNKPLLKLKEDTNTRWNSIFDMLERVWQNKELLVSTMALLRSDDSLKLLHDEWDIIEHTVDMLSVFHEVTMEICSEKIVPLSKTCVLSRIIVSRVKIFLENDGLPEVVKYLGSELLNRLSKRFRDWENFDFLGQSVFLDPRFKKQGFADEEKFKFTYQALIDKIQIANSTFAKQIEYPTVQSSKSRMSNSLWKEFDEEIEKLHSISDPTASARVEVNKYLAEPLLARSKQPFRWWNQRRSIYPNLYSIAVKYLCIPASSVPCEMLFTKVGHNICEKRRQLKSEKLTQMLFLSSNL